MTEDEELADRMRAGLGRQAEQVDVTVPMAHRVRGAARRRRTGRVAVVLAGASVAAVAVAFALQGTPSSTPDDPPASGAKDQSSTEEWRTEHWRDLQVDVPAGWGYGGAPRACGVGALVDADGRRLDLNVDPFGTVPYVGRPISNTDACFTMAGPPRAPYVWLGAAVEPGTVDLGDGYTQETVEVNGSTLTVATDDPALRRRILGSASGGERCLSEVEVQGSLEHDGPVDDSSEPTGLLVCAYRTVGSGSGIASLTYAALLDGSALRDYQQSLVGAERSPDQCPTIDYSENEWVVLEQVADDGTVTDRDVVHFACPGIALEPDSLGGISNIELTPERARPWAVGGIPAVIYGPTGGKGAMIDSFIGPFG